MNETSNKLSTLISELRKAGCPQEDLYAAATLRTLFELKEYVNTANEARFDRIESSINNLIETTIGSQHINNALLIEVSRLNDQIGILCKQIGDLGFTPNPEVDTREEEEEGREVEDPQDQQTEINEDDLPPEDFIIFNRDKTQRFEEIGVIIKEPKVCLYQSENGLCVYTAHLYEYFDDRNPNSRKTYPASSSMGALYGRIRANNIPTERVYFLSRRRHPPSRGGGSVIYVEDLEVLLFSLEESRIYKFAAKHFSEALNRLLKEIDP